MARKGGRKAARKRIASRRRGGARTRAAARKNAGARRSARATRTTRRRTAGTRTPKKKGARKAARKAAGRKTAGRKTARKAPRKTTRKTTAARRKTSAAGRKARSTGTPAGAGNARHVPALERERRRLRDLEETIPGPPSSLDMDRSASAARTGRAEMREARQEHHETSPVLTGGDVDADWEDAYAVGDEAPGGDNPTPDQDRVEDIGKALGVQYEDSEELKSADKIAERDRHRWELDPASSEDYKDRD